MLTSTEIRGLALARGFVVFIMPAVHSVLIYSNDTVKTGWLGIGLGLLAEQPGAQLFMLLMGLFIGMGRSKSRMKVTERFMMLLLAGYLLNFLRLVLPYWWNGLPNAFLDYNNIPDDGHTVLHLLAIGDILQFAALGYLFCQLVQHYLKTLLSKLMLLILFLVVSPLTWTLHLQYPVGQYLLGLFNGLPSIAFFPFFPWVCYPLAGLIMAQVIQCQHQRFRLIFWLLISIALIILGFTFSSIEPSNWNSNFYRLGIGGTLLHLGVAIAWIVLFTFLAKKIRMNFAFFVLERVSKKITLIYFIQWTLIIWMIPVFGFNELDLVSSIAALLATTLLSLGVPFIIDKMHLTK